MSSISNSIVSKKYVFWNVIDDTVKSLLPALALALALALQFEASKWQGQALKCQGQGLTSLESHTEALAERRGVLGEGTTSLLSTTGFQRLL